MTRRDAYISALLTSHPLLFTDYFFREQYGRSFVVGKHHVRIAEALQRVLQGETTRLIINLPPRYGKTEMVVKAFIAMGLAVNPAAKFLHLSYSASLAEDNSVAVKDIVNLDGYKRLFPSTRIREGADTKTKWQTTAGGGVYATSTLGQITGFGAGLVEDAATTEYQFGGAVIIDDPIKPEDALSDLQRESVNRRFETTIRNRVNSRKTPFVIIMQRLHANDLSGYLMKTESGVWECLSIPALDDNGGALWPFKHTAEELHALREINPFVFDTQYMQHPTPLEGLLYAPERWREYETLPITARAVRKNYTDTADTGNDDLVSINYVETERGNYVLDILCTKDAMEATEPVVAQMLTRDNIEVANIESNNGGRGFARNVETQLRLLGNNTTRVEWFHTSANKEVRIFTNAAEVQNLTYFPKGWRTIFPRVANQLDGFLRAGRNAHDDVADALTGTIEKRGTDNIKTYSGEIAGDAVCVFACSGNDFAWVRSVISGGKCHITSGGLVQPSNDVLTGLDAARYIFAGGKEEYITYNAIKSVKSDLFAFGGLSGGQVEAWRGIFSNFLYNADDAAVLALAARAGEVTANTNIAAVCLAVLAQAVVRDLTAAVK